MCVYVPNRIESILKRIAFLKEELRLEKDQNKINIIKDEISRLETIFFDFDY